MLTAMHAAMNAVMQLALLAAMLAHTAAVGETTAVAAAPTEPPLPVGPLAPPHPARPPTPYWSWAVIPTSFHGARKDARYTDEEVVRLAKFQVLALEKWCVCGTEWD